jgi:hypothetical protein
MLSNIFSKESNIIDSFLKQFGYGDVPPSDHFVHTQPPDRRHFHSIIDVNYKQIVKPDLAELPHDVYRVKFKEGDDKPSVLKESLYYIKPNLIR